MKPEITKQLQAILDSREQQKQAAATQASEAQREQAANLVDFAAKKAEVIRPAFQEILEMYQARTVPVRIEEQDERPNSKGGTESPTITLDLDELHSHYGTMKPEFKLTFDKRTRKLSLYTSTRSQAGPAGDVSLDAITGDWIHTAFLKYEGGKF
jgi:hypothetical protein